MRLAGVRLVPSASMDMPNSTPPRRLHTPLDVCVCAGGNPRARGLQMTTNVQRTGKTGHNWNAHKGHNKINRLYLSLIHI